MIDKSIELGDKVRFIFNTIKGEETSEVGIVWDINKTKSGGTRYSIHVARNGGFNAYAYSDTPDHKLKILKKNEATVK